MRQMGGTEVVASNSRKRYQGRNQRSGRVVAESRIKLGGLCLCVLCDGTGWPRAGEVRQEGCTYCTGVSESNGRHTTSLMEPEGLASPCRSEPSGLLEVHQALADQVHAAAVGDPAPPLAAVKEEAEVEQQEHTPHDHATCRAGEDGDSSQDGMGKDDARRCRGKRRALPSDEVPEGFTCARCFRSKVSRPHTHPHLSHPEAAACLTRAVAAPVAPLSPPLFPAVSLID